MKIIKVKDYEEMSIEAAKLFQTEVKQNPKLHVAYSVGQTPIGMFQELLYMYKGGAFSLKDTKAFLVDDYCQNEYHYESGSKYFLQQYFLNKTDMKFYRVFAPNADQDDLEMACKDYEELLSEEGIDLAILGIGANGHIAYNEPNTPFDSTVRVEKLEFKTRWDRQQFFGNNIAETPTHVVTMGLADLMKAKKIILLISGENKKEAFKVLKSKVVSEGFPASILHNHPNVTVIVDESAYSR